MKKFLMLLALGAVAVVAQAGSSSAEHAAVGVKKCKMCHKVEHASWETTKHATVDPKAECETCHGNGGDYWKMPVMKDPAKAAAAGLISKPPKETCIATCHKAEEFKDEMLTQVHEKKAKK